MISVKILMIISLFNTIKRKQGTRHIFLELPGIKTEYVRKSFFFYGSKDIQQASIKSL